MDDSSAGQQYYTMRVGDDYAIIYDRDGWPIGHAERQDTTISKNLDGSPQETEPRWFASVKSSMLLKWKPDGLRHTTGYATLDEAATALTTGKWITALNGKTPNDTASLERVLNEIMGN